MTVYGSKSELEWKRYQGNWDNALIDALLTSENHNFWFDCWIFRIHAFLDTGRQDLSKGVKINPIGFLLRLVALEGSLPQSSCQGYKKPQAPFRPGRDHILWVLLFAWYFSTCFSLFQTQKNTKKTHQNFLILLSSPKHKVLFLYPIFLSLVLHIGFGV